MAGRGPRTGKNISRKTGRSPTPRLSRRKYSIFSNKTVAAVYDRRGSISINIVGGHRPPLQLIDDPLLLGRLLSSFIVRIPVVQMTIFAGLVDAFDGLKQSILIFGVNCL